jgi:uncharacterized protein
MKRSGKATGLRPDFCFSRAIDIQPGWLKSRGINGLLLDIDNTITRWERQVVPPEELSWLIEIQAAGIACRLLSNGLARKKALVAKQTGIPHVSGYYIKPLRRSFRQGLKDLGLPANQVLMVGDSVVTDIIAANLAGLWTALVEPLSPVDFMGSKLYRLIEHLLRLRQAFIPAQDYRGNKNADSSGTNASA